MRKTSNCDRHQRQRPQSPSSRQQTTAGGREEPARPWDTASSSNRSGSKPLKRRHRTLASGVEQFLAGVRSLRRLSSSLALARRGGQHQPAAVQHAQELLQLLEGDFLRGKLVLETLLDLVQAGFAVEHLQDRVFFLLEAEVVQPDRLLDDPVGAAQVVLLARDRSGRLRMGSFRAELESRLSCRVTMRGVGARDQVTGDRGLGIQGIGGRQFPPSGLPGPDPRPCPWL